MIKDLCAFIAMLFFATFIVMMGSVAADHHLNKNGQCKELFWDYEHDDKCDLKIPITMIGIAIATLPFAIATTEPGCNTTCSTSPKTNFAFGVYINQKYEPFWFKYKLNF